MKDLRKIFVFMCLFAIIAVSAGAVSAADCNANSEGNAQLILNNSSNNNVTTTVNSDKASATHKNITKINNPTNDVTDDELNDSTDDEIDDSNNNSTDESTDDELSDSIDNSAVVEMSVASKGTSMQSIMISAHKYNRYIKGVSTLSGLLKYGGGDCWAMSEYIYTKAKAAGIHCRIIQYATKYSNNHRSVQYLKNGVWYDFPFYKKISKLYVLADSK